MALVLLLLGCWGSDEPLVRAVEKPKVTAEAVAEKRHLEELRSSPRNLEVNYKKPEGVYIDVCFLGGRQWENVRDTVADQLGAVVEQGEVVDGVQKVSFERGDLKMIGGEIDVLDVALPEPVRRSEALALTGFSPLADKYLAFTFEFRVTQYQGFRRIILHRAERNSEEVHKITAYKRQEGPSGRGLPQ